jgi:hypothetical protein
MDGDYEERDILVHNFSISRRLLRSFACVCRRTDFSSFIICLFHHSLARLLLFIFILFHFILANENAIA